jgi:hypothetical protein
MPQADEFPAHMAGNPFNPASVAFEEVRNDQQAQSLAYRGPLTGYEQAGRDLDLILPIETSGDRSR